MREYELYEALADGESLDTYHAMWYNIGGDTDRSYLKNNASGNLALTRTNAEKNTVEGKSSVWNLEEGSTTGMDIFCNPNYNAGTNECAGSACTENSECQSNVCNAKDICTLG